jgi:hypothetical protein
MTEPIDEISSLVSVPITVCNVPDPMGVGAEFVYNFYVTNEDKEYTPQPTTPIDYSEGLIDRETVENIEARERGSLRTRVPRYIRLNIQTNLLGIESAELGEVSSEIRQALSNTKIGQTVYNIEGAIENPYIAKSNIGDASVKSRLQRSIYRITLSLLNSGSIMSEISDEQVSNRLNKMLSDEIDASSILDALSDNELKGIRFVNEVSGLRFNRVDNKASLVYPTKINADGYRTVVSRQAVSNPFAQNFMSDLLGDYSDDSMKNPLLDASLLPSFGSTSTNAIENLQPTLKILETSEERLAHTRAEISSQDWPQVRHVGYVVEKISQSPAGTIETFDDFVSLNPQISEFIDPNVKYGHTYFYKARQLYIVKFPQIVDINELGEITYQIVTAAIASSAPKPAAVQAVEIDPPIAPGTLICSFIYKTGNGIRLDWARPTNPTMDIKKYQVFRRKSIREPFELIAEYDFTDEGYTQFDQRESIDNTLVRRVPAPQYSHIDSEFNRESTFIYCVAAVDAHGLTSNYGTQLEAEFDRFANKLKTRVVSRAGAPRAYPNYFVDPTELEEFGSDRLIEDVIKDGGHGRMRIYFNPDAYRVSSDDDGTDTEPLVLSSASGQYKFQIVNLDRQLSKNLTITVTPNQSLTRLL